MDTDLPPIPTIVLRDVSKSYRLGSTSVQALRAVNVIVQRSECVVLHGPSGSGKSTLLNLIGCMDKPDAGQVEIDGHLINAMPEARLTRFRASHIGFVFQSFNLIPTLSVIENVEYPLQLLPVDRRERLSMAHEALDAVGLGELVDRRPDQLSGGQRQRVAIARALAKRPALVIADEPTANLDHRTGAEIIDLMRRLSQRSGTTFLCSSHDPQMIGAADRTIGLLDGGIAPPVDHRRTPTKVSCYEPL